MRSAASARKLVSALWQLNKGDEGVFEEEEEEIGWDAAAARRCSDHRRSASLEVSAPSPCHRLLVFCGDRSWSHPHPDIDSLVQFSKISRRKSKTMKNDEEQRSWHNGHAHGQWFSDVMSNGGTVEVSSTLLIIQIE